MKKSLLLIFTIIFALTLQAQKDTTKIAGYSSHNDIFRDAPNPNITIYPVPVRNNIFTIKTDREISFIKITNIIGQDIFRVQYKNPQQSATIALDNPKRGMYLVNILFSDGARIVKKILVEESE
ncbi:MAG: T9SS type A sorting domain-containing protein [Bacteroidales bacterium]|nr:T9SS type A sorting domain-containing protein [Bacteroidales bacterium]